MPILRTLCAFLALMLALSGAARADVTTIYQGKGVGAIRLGQTLEEVQKSLGAPARTTASPNDPNSKLMDYPALGLSVFMGSSGGVIGVAITGKSYHTPEDVAVGSLETSVRKAYGKGLERGPGNVVYSDRGLGFRYAAGRVESIYVFAPEEERPLLGDRIIEPGKRVGEIRLGDPVSKVEDAWGKADKVGPLSKGSDRKLYRYKEEAVQLVVGSAKVEGVLVETGDFITRSGVKVGSSKDDVLAAFGKSFKSHGDDRIWFPEAGIGFVLLKGRVIQIQVVAGSR